MSVAKPADIPGEFARLFNSRDKHGLVALYADGATLTVDGKAVARGKAEIEAVVGPFLESGLKMEARCAAWQEAGDLALVRNEWKLTAPDGSVAMAGTAAEVLRRGPDGRWRYAIDDATYASRP